MVSKVVFASVMMSGVENGFKSRLCFCVNVGLRQRRVLKVVFVSATMSGSGKE
jgi:hypothetical protein